MSRRTAPPCLCIVKNAWNHVVPGISYCLFYRFQRPHGVENGDDGHPHVGKDGLPHVGHAQGAQGQHQQLHPQGEHDVLTDNAQRLLGDADGGGDFGGLVVHEHDIGGLDITREASIVRIAIIAS